MGVPTAEIWQRVEESLKAVGMYEHRKKSPNRLSGGQKQRVSIAGVLAMHPRCIVLDEPTAMLDPLGRKEVIRAVRALNYVENITIILITHFMEEIVNADRVFVMNKGKIAMSGDPREVLAQVDELKSLHLTVPPVTLLAHELRKSGIPNIPPAILTIEELVAALSEQNQC
jgi:energy-coupling factor transport system ATP-binding protein